MAASAFSSGSWINKISTLSIPSRSSEPSSDARTPEALKSNFLSTVLSASIKKSSISVVDGTKRRPILVANTKVERSRPASARPILRSAVPLP